MPGGKVHGGGGHGNHSRNQRKKYEHAQIVKEKLERKKQAKERKKQKTKTEFLEVFVPNLKQQANQVIKIIKNKISLKKVSKPNSIKMFLALDKWYLEKINQEAKKRKIVEESFSIEELNKFSLIGQKKKIDYLSTLLGNNPSVFIQKEIVKDIEKWKSRIPRILEGKY